MVFPSIRPDSYFKGANLEVSLPRNVVLFARNSREDLGPSFTFCHGRYNLILSLEGSCDVILDDRHVELPPESALITHPWQSFRFVFSRDMPLEWVFLAFELPDPPGDIPRTEARRMNDAMCAAARRAVHRYQEDGPGTWMVSFLLLLLEEMRSMPALTEVPSSQLQPNVSYIMQIQRFVIENCRNLLAIRDVAAHFFVSESRLRQVYRENTGVSIGAYIRHMRMNEVARCLVETDASVSAIADDCSFSSVQVMSRAFARYFAVPPGQYRRQRKTRQSHGDSP